MYFTWTSQSYTFTSLEKMLPSSLNFYLILLTQGKSLDFSCTVIRAGPWPPLTTSCARFWHPKRCLSWNWWNFVSTKQTKRECYLRNWMDKKILFALLLWHNIKIKKELNLAIFNIVNFHRKTNLKLGSLRNHTKISLPVNSP